MASPRSDDVWGKEVMEQSSAQTPHMYNLKISTTVRMAHIHSESFTNNNMYIEASSFLQRSTVFLRIYRKPYHLYLLLISFICCVFAGFIDNCSKPEMINVGAMRMNGERNCQSSNSTSKRYLGFVPTNLAPAAVTAIGAPAR
jgi:hypothetical protein